MISTTVAKLIGFMPDKLVTLVAKKVLDGYLNKYANITVKGRENLMGISTPTILICNHLSNSDGLVLNRILKDIDPTFVAGVKLSQDSVTNLGINIVKTTNIKPNSADVKGLKNAVKLIQGGESLLIFPEGTRSRVGSMIEAKRGILLIGKMTGAPVIPIGIHGTEKLLPIDMDGDMSSETFNYADVTVNIGKQFDFPTIEEGQDKRAFEAYAINKIMKEIAALVPHKYRGVYK